MDRGDLIGLLGILTGLGLLIWRGRRRLERAAQIGMDPALLHRVAVIGSGTLDSLPHNGAVVTLLSVCGCTHGSSYKDVFMVAILGAIIALVVIILLGSLVGSF